jgi:hypothetical protein
MMQSTIFFAPAVFTPAVLLISCSSSARSAGESTGVASDDALALELPVDVWLALELPVDVGLELALPADVVVELELAVELELELELPHPETTRTIRTAANSGQPLRKRIATLLFDHHSTARVITPLGPQRRGYWRATRGLSIPLARQAKTAVRSHWATFRTCASRWPASTARVPCHTDSLSS